MRAGVVLAVGILILVAVAFSTVARASGGPRPPEVADTNPPTGTILGPRPGTWTAYIQISVRFVDPDGIMVSSLSLKIDDVPLTTSWSPPVLYGYASGFAEGPHTAEARASDQLGNGPTVLSWAFSVDTTPPVLDITAPLGNPELPDGSVTLTWTASDNGSGIDHYEIRLDYGTQTEVGTVTAFPFRDLAPGIHYFQLFAYDKVRNYAYRNTMATVPPGPPGSPGNTTTRITVVMPDAIPAWAIVLVVINAVEAATIVWVALRRRRERPGVPPPP